MASSPGEASGSHSTAMVRRLLLAWPLVAERGLSGAQAAAVASPGPWSTGPAAVCMGLAASRRVGSSQGCDPVSAALTGSLPLSHWRSP